MFSITPPPATMRAFENLSRTAHKTRERCQPVLFSMVESDLVSPVEHHLVASSFMAGFMKESPNQRWQGSSVRGHLVHIWRDHGVVELFLLGNSTALCAAYDGTSHTFDDDFARCDFPRVQNFPEISDVGTNLFATSAGSKPV